MKNDVEVHGGLTFQVGPMSSNQWARLDVTISVDSEKPLEPQLKEKKAAAQAAFEVTMEELDRQVEEVYDAKK